MRKKLKIETGNFNSAERKSIIEMVESVLVDSSYSATRNIGPYKVTAQCIPNSQACQLRFISRDRSKFTN